MIQNKQHTDMTTDHYRWDRIKKRLHTELGDDVFLSWFGRVEFEALDQGVARLSVPTRFLRKWIQAHYADRVLALWKAEEPAIGRVELTVRSAAMRILVAKPKPPETSPPPPQTCGVLAFNGESRASVPFVSVHEALGGSPLDPRLSFETFIVGRSNTLAHAAAKQIAISRRGDPLMFNPLYIHAGVGLGKTHLLQAITWAGNSGDRKVLYLTAERFMYSFVSALKSQTTLAFKEALRAIDVLVIDDLQFLQGRSTQQEFCHTINALIDAGRQVVIASDRPPADLESLDDRVRSRLAGGLVVEIGTLGEELRLEILKNRIAVARQHHPGF
jgi:chromosomal replication initiator protein